jgi:tetratricopeptide (TPR) repeat protein
MSEFTLIDEQTTLDDASQRLEKGDFQGAHSLCLQVLQANPKSAYAYVLLGILTARHNNHEKAIELFDRALAVDPGNASAMANKARSHISRFERVAAVETAEAAERLNPTDAHTLDTLGVVFSRSSLHERAVAYYKKAVAVDPTQSNYFFNLGASLQFTGQMDEARAAYEKCLELAPRDTRAIASITQITKQTEEKNDLERLERIFMETVSNPNDALRVGHAIAKAHEDMGHPEEALFWLKRVKKWKWNAVSYSANIDAALFETSMKLAETLKGRTGYADAQPIFIVGMPRTGTTLVDRILSSHSQVTSAGELAEMSVALKRLSGTTSNMALEVETLQAANRVDLEHVGRIYMDAVRKTLGLTGRFIDKLPMNALYAPIILAALPNARVICLRRHPADTVLSNYRQLFAAEAPYYNYAYDLAACAQYYVGFDRMIRHFRETLPADRFREVHYEDVVANIEGETRSLLDFCGLDFEPACIAFHENKAPVATASSAQVREPLYTRSMGRWKRYEAGLGPALDVLEAAGCIDPSERAPK